jgi:hypothetical protein
MMPNDEHNAVSEAGQARASSKERIARRCMHTESKPTSVVLNQCESQEGG